MPQRHYYLVSALPHLGELGSVPPVSAAELLDHVEAEPAARELVEAVLLIDDLLMREALAVGELDEASPAALTTAQVRGEAPLPECLSAGEGGEGEAEADRRRAADGLWAACFRYAAAVARRRGCRLLGQWIDFEVSLRNALARERAKLLGLNADDYLVAPELAEGDWDLADAVAEWSAAANPLEGLRALDRGRWAWLTQREAWFSFNDDELVVYAVRLSLLERWHRIGRAAEQAAATADRVNG